MEQMRIVVPNGHLSYARSEEGSFNLAIQEKIDAIAADSGSADIGPYPLGSDTCVSPTAWQTHDIEMMLLAARERDIPMVIGSCNDTGTNSGVEKFAGIVRQLAKKHRLSPFKMATVPHLLTKEALVARMRKGAVLKGLDGRRPLTMKELEATRNLVPVMGVEPYLAALNSGADVVLTSRSSDTCIFAALALWKGFPKAQSYYFGKVLECASFCAEPYMGKESIIGTITRKDVSVKACHPKQRCTPASLASHAMYERRNPYFETVAGGRLDLRKVRYEQVDEKTTRVSGMRFIQAGKYWVKIEGSTYEGERRYAIVGIRDPHTIVNIDKAEAWARMKVVEQYGTDGKDYYLFYHIYGKNGVLGAREPVKDIRSHELGIAVEAVAKDAQLAEEICTLASRGLFYARLPTKGTAGGAAVLTEDILKAAPVYRWSIHHIMELKDAMELWKVNTCIVRGR